MINKELIEIILPVVQLLILITLIVYVIKTWRVSSSTQAAAEVFALSLQVMKEARDIEIAPYIIAYFDIRPGEQAVFFIAKNIGKSTARDIRIQFKPKLINNSGEDIGDHSILKDGIASLAPDQEIKIFVDSTNAFFFEQTDHPDTYDVSLSYFGGLKDTQRISEQVLDVSADKRYCKSMQNNHHDFTHETEKISRNIERICKELSTLNENLSGGVQLRNTITPSSLQTGEDSWQNVIATKLLEFKYLWSSLYGGHHEKLAQPFLGKIKNRLSYLTDQLLVTTSLSPPSINEDLKNQVLDIVAKMADLNSIRINPDDPETVTKFNTSGDKLLNGVEDFIAKIKPVASAS